MGVYHVYPNDDLKEHITDLDKGLCPCLPSVKIVEGGILIIHNSYDHRELVEQLLSEINND